VSRYSGFGIATKNVATQGVTVSRKKLNGNNEPAATRASSAMTQSDSNSVVMVQ